MLRLHSRFLTFAVCAATVFSLPAPALGQESNSKLAERFFNFYVANTTANVALFLEAFPDYRNQILANQAQIEAGVRPGFGVSSALGAQVSSFPLGSSAGGFSWTFDPSLGTFNRVSESFGPVFAERALTVGRGRVNVGANVQRTTFDSLGNRDLSGGDLKSYFGLKGVFPANTGVDQIFVEDSLDLNVSTTTVSLFGTFGLTDRLDLGIAVPITQVDLAARFDSRIGVNTTVDPEISFQDSVGGDASGIGDIILRGKYMLWRTAGGGVATGVDLRLPTGDEENWLGVAATQAKVYVATSAAFGRLSPHLNLGYTFSHANSLTEGEEAVLFAPSNEITYAAGIDASVTPRITVVGDVLGRNLRKFGTFTDQSTEFGANFRRLGFVKGNLNLLLGSVGVKYNLFGTSLIAANVLFPLNDAGLQDKLTWVVGFEQSFSGRR